MRGRLLRAAALSAAFAATACGSAAAAADDPVEGYRSPDGKVACVLFQDYDAKGDAVACGTKQGSRGVLLTGSGAARSTDWRWPAADLGDKLFAARWGRTLFLSGGTAKLTGTSATLRCTFQRPTSVVCLNRTGHGLVVTPSRTSVVAPLKA